jgi:hypothetical protein
MPRCACLAVVFALGTLPVAAADAPVKRNTPSPSVEQLIQQLGDRDYHVRDQANRKLAQLGIEALPTLQKSRSSQTDPEVRRRLDELIPNLERTAILMPKLVTLHMTNRPIRDILAELGKQTGYKILDGNENMGGMVFAQGGIVQGMNVPNGGPNASHDKLVYTFHLDKVPFWQAFDQISEASGLALQQGYWGDDALRVYHQDMYVPFGCYNGPFKVVATGFNYNRTNNFGQLPRNPAQAGQQTQEFLQINLQIATEPRLPILKVGQVRLTFAEDDEKHSMLPFGDGNGNGMWGQRFYYGGWGRSHVHQTQAGLVWPSKTSRTVKTLKGVIPVTLLADQKPSLVTDRILGAKGKKFKLGDASFSIEEAKELPGKQYQISLSVTETSKDNPQDYSRIQSIQQRLELQDDKGNKFPAYVNITNWGGPTNASFQIMTQPNGNAKLGKPSKLLFYAWVLMEHEVEFEFRGLPLP